MGTDVRNAFRRHHDGIRCGMVLRAGPRPRRLTTPEQLRAYEAKKVARQDYQQQRAAERVGSKKKLRAQTTSSQNNLRPHVLYRFYDAHGDLLYIGITVNLPSRLRDHSQKAWWLDVANITLEHLADRSSALTAERFAIAAEVPTYNDQHNGRRAR